MKQKTGEKIVILLASLVLFVVAVWALRTNHGEGCNVPLIVSSAGLFLIAIRQTVVAVRKNNKR